jgi:YHS domain-containing protein
LLLGEQDDDFKIPRLFLSYWVSLVDLVLCLNHRDTKEKAMTSSKCLVFLLIAAVMSASWLSSAAADSSAAPVAPVNTTEGLALKGYDPVAYFTEGQPTKGTDQYSFQWKGVTYRFASAENLQRFKADPEKYLPQYGGYCAYAMSLDRIADIDPFRWAIVDGKLYLNNGFIAQDLWSLNKSGNIASADHNWPLYPKKAEDK